MLYMNRFLVCCIMFSFFVKMNSQNFPESLSEKFANQTGVLISKEYIEMGFMDQIDFRFVKMKNLFTNETASGLRLEYMPGNEIINSAKIAYIDSDEQDALIKAIKILQVSVLNTKYSNQSDFTFRCRSGLVIGYFYDANKSKWQPFIQINYKDPQSTIRVENDSFAYLFKLLEDVKLKK